MLACEARKAADVKMLKTSCMKQERTSDRGENNDPNPRKPLNGNQSRAQRVSLIAGEDPAVVLSKLSKKKQNELTSNGMNQISPTTWLDQELAFINDRAASINSCLKDKTSNKWDLKERLRHAENANKEYRCLISDIQAKVTLVKEHWKSYEDLESQRLQSLHDDLIEFIEMERKTNESKLVQRKMSHRQFVNERKKLEAERIAEIISLRVKNEELVMTVNELESQLKSYEERHVETANLADQTRQKVSRGSYFFPPFLFISDNVCLFLID
jgi:hypothetical protein